MIEFKDTKIADAIWLQGNPNSVLVVSEQGKVMIYDLSKSIDLPEENFDLGVRETDIIAGVVESDRQGIIVFLTKSGILMQYELGDGLKEREFYLDRIYPS